MRLTGSKNIMRAVGGVLPLALLSLSSIAYADDVSGGAAEAVAEQAASAEETKRGILASHLMSDEFASKTGLDVRGWFAGGATVNTSGDNGGFNGPVTFYDRADTFQLGQSYLIIDRAVARGGDDWSLGGRFDMNYGTDSVFTFARGWDDKISDAEYYQLALPQLYAEVNVPVGSGLDVKLGHFYTPIGYEVVTAPDNFFTSHAYTMQYGEPFTHFGGLASYQVSEKVGVSAGLVNGWDNLDDDQDNSLAALAGVSYAATDSTAIALTAISGDEGTDANRTLYSLVVTQALNDQLTYVIQHDHGSQENASEGQNAYWYGINQYLMYKVNELWSTGVRFEWFRDADGYRVAGVRASGVGGIPADYYQLTLGGVVNVCDSLKFKPELRWDHQSAFDGAEPTLTTSGDADQLIMSANFILSF